MNSTSGQKRDYEGSRTVYPYLYLRRAAKRMLDIAEQEETDSFYTSMMSIVATAFYLEASLNHVGANCIKHWDLLERKLPPKTKLEVIAGEINISLDFGKRPHQSFTRLFNLRNQLAHGREESVQKEWRGSGTQEEASKHLRAEWESYCTLIKVQNLYQDAEQIVKTLLGQANLEVPPGMMSSSEWGTKNQ